MSDQDARDLASRTRADPDLKREQFLDTFRAAIPGFIATPPGVVWVMADAAGELTAELEQTALVDEVRRYFRELGRNIFGLPPIDAAPATGTSTWQLSNVPANGAIIPVGTPVRAADINLEVTEDVAVTVLQTTATVPVSVIDDGAAGNDLVGALDVLAALPFVDSAALDGPTSGGIDAELDEAYEQRFRERIRHIGRPTLPADFADRLRSLPGVYRVLPLDGYIPVNGGTPAQTGVERAITLVPIDLDGESISSGVRALGVALLEAEREPNWIINVIAASYATLPIAADATVWPGYDPVDVKARAEAALTAFATPGTWGAPPSGELPVWHDEPIMYRSEVIARLNEVEGLRRVVNGTVRINALDADYTLPTPAGLPRPGTMTVTIVAGP